MVAYVHNASIIPGRQTELKTSLGYSGDLRAYETISSPWRDNFLQGGGHWTVLLRAAGKGFHAADN